MGSEERVALTVFDDTPTSDKSVVATVDRTVTQ